MIATVPKQPQTIKNPRIIHTHRHHQQNVHVSLTMTQMIRIKTETEMEIEITKITIDSHSIRSPKPLRANRTIISSTTTPDTPYIRNP